MKIDIESRTSTIADLKLPTWQKVMEREYELWTTVPIVIDTAEQSVNESVGTMLTLLGHF